MQSAQFQDLCCGSCNEGMGASGGLSNHDLPALLRLLTEGPARKARLAAERGGWSDGRKSFGTVSGAVLLVLTAASGEMRAREIHRAAESLLGCAISRHTVSDFLVSEAGREGGRVERVRFAYYRSRSIAQ